MRVENIYKGHLIVKPPKLNNANISGRSRVGSGGSSEPPF